MLIGPDYVDWTRHVPSDTSFQIYLYIKKSCVFDFHGGHFNAWFNSDVQWLPLGSCWVSPYNISRLDLEDHLTAVMITLGP